jgi:SPP1 gp7 family putative phage head morphogenesis protein
MLPDSGFWADERKRLAAVVQPRLEHMAVAGAQSATQQIGVGFDYNLYNDLASQWAADYTDTLLQQLGATSESVVGDILSGWIQDGGTIGDLQSLLTPAFGVDRAFTIAVTETTRAFASGQFLAFSREGVTKWRWNTNHDELVCPFCGDVDGTVVEIGSSFGDFDGEEVDQPPYHVNCRCWVSPVVLQAFKMLAPSMYGAMVHRAAVMAYSGQIMMYLQKSAVDSKALQIANDKKEHIAVITPAGQVLYENVGNSHHVDIPAFVPLKGNIILHNHPAGTSFSAEDVRHGIASGAAAIRVVTPQGTEYGMDFEPGARGNNTMAQQAAKSRPDLQNKEWDNVWQQFSSKNPTAKYKARRIK